MSYVVMQPPDEPPTIVSEGAVPPPVETGGAAQQTPDATTPPSNDPIPHEYSVDPSFFGWLKGKWTLDAALCELPSRAAIEQSDPITMTIDQDGGFVVEAPRVVVNGELGTFIANMGFDGTLEVGGDLDSEGWLPMAMENFRVTHRTLDTSGFHLPFAVDFIANAIFDAFTAKMPTSTLLSIGGSGGSDVLKLSSPPYVSALTRPRVDCSVTDVTFVGRHPEMRSGSVTDNLRGSGAELDAPEWVKGGKNAVVSYSRKETVVLEVTVVVSDPGRPFKLFGIDKANPAMNFESPVAISTGQPQKLQMTGKAPLPEYLRLLKSTITWNVQTAEDERWFYAGKSGEHSLYVTWGPPIERTSLFGAGVDEAVWRNFLTPARIDFAMREINKEKPGTVADVHIATKIVHSQINHFTSANEPHRPLNAEVPSDVRVRTVPILWGLFDPDNFHCGNCFEATLLMEFALRLLGVQATQFHVYASDDLAVLKAGKNIRYRKLNGVDFGNGVQFRDCEHHQEKEKLVLSFNPSPAAGQGYGLNEGEGCCEVEGLLYCGLDDHVFFAADGQPAAYELLLEFEKIATQAKPNPRVLNFEVWSPLDRDNDPCFHADPKKYDDPAKNAPSKPGGIPVPKDAAP